MTYLKSRGKMHKEVREIVKQIRARGYNVVASKKHLKVKDAEGNTVYVLPTTPGGGRWKQNLLADLRRKGILE